MFAVLAVTLGLCPDPALHEGPRDCPWAAIARAAASGDAAEVLVELAPKIWGDARRERESTMGLRAAWGTSRNFDEHEKAPIVAPAILAALGEQLGVNGTGEVVHAGLQHTYGYLFSTLWTSFGYKRARWVDGELERGLGLPDGMLGPTPKRGTLFANVTCALSRLVFHKQARARLASTCASVSGPEIANLTQRPLETWLERVRDTTLETDLVPLGPQHYLLVYSVTTGSEQKLLTSFPVDEKMAQSLRAQPTGDVSIVTRYNAAVPGLDKPVPGNRQHVIGK